MGWIYRKTIQKTSGYFVKKSYLQTKLNKLYYE